MVMSTAQLLFNLSSLAQLRIVRCYITSKEHNYSPFHNHNNIRYIQGIQKSKPTNKMNDGEIRKI